MSTHRGAILSATITTLWAAAALAGPPCSEPLNQWWESPTAQASYDGANCLVASIPANATGFIWDRAWYVTYTQDHCDLGWYDGANCYWQPAPARAFIYENGFYSHASSPGVCPAGSWWNSLHCYWGSAPTDTTAFEWAGNWYTTPTEHCSVGIDDGANCRIGQPPAGETPFILNQRLYYGYEEVLNTAAAQVVRTCGDTYATADLDGCMNAEAPPTPSILRGISTADSDYHPDSYQPTRLGTNDVVDAPRQMGPPLAVDQATGGWPYSSGRAGDIAQTPPARSSNDGRIFIDDGPRLSVYMPERTGHDDIQRGLKPWSEPVNIPREALLAAGRPSAPIYQYTICDPSGPSVSPDNALSMNRTPRTCQAYVDGTQQTGDCYDITVLYEPSIADKWWLGSLDITLFVSDPKTEYARPWIYPRNVANNLGAQPTAAQYTSSAFWAPYRDEADVFHLDLNADGVIDTNGNATERWQSATGTASNYTLPDGFAQRRLALFEPTTTSDGNVVVFNLMHGLYYGVNDVAPCRASGFTALRPLSHMPGDARVDLDLARAGAATGGFRDPNGAVIQPGTQIVGAYPWMDRQGKNIFFARSNLRRSAWRAVNSWPESSLINPDHVDQGAGKGVVGLGAWTQGKMVVLDNMLNATDWAGAQTTRGLSTGPNGEDFYWVNASDTTHTFGRFMRLAFEVQLYQDDPIAIRPSFTSLINSNENQFNHLDTQSPTLPFDVVWRMSSNNGHTAEIAFDDYMDNQALVVAHMNASQKTIQIRDLPEAVPWDGFTAHDLLDHRGFDFRLTETPRLQNASTASQAYDPNAVLPPAHLWLRGGARVEPVALGGVQGKGVYLDGKNDFVEMSFISSSHPHWFYGIWLDNRALSASQTRRLFTFNDGSWIGFSAQELVFFNAHATPAQVPEKRYNLQHLALSNEQFFHLGFVVRRQYRGIYIDVRLNGDPTPITTLAWEAPAGFSMFAGRGTVYFYVGNPTSGAACDAGFNGWIDELRIYALTDAQVRPGHPARSAWLELGCNLALGTIKSEPNQPDTCEQLALVDHPTPLEMGPQYGMAECIDRVHRNPNADPAIANRCKRSTLLATPAHQAGTPRVDSSSNPFCAGCHLPNHPIPGLRPAALDYTGTLRECDGRRQPMDWPAVIGGATVSGTAPSGSHPICAPATLPGANGGSATLSDPWFDINGRWTP